MYEHRTVLFFENILPDLNNEIGSDTDQQAIKSGMMELAERYAVIYDRFSARFPIRDNMCRV